MIDTGSTRSFISPKKVEEYFTDYKFYEPFKVISTHASSLHDEVIEIPLLKTFKSMDRAKFYIYDIDSAYDGLIGSDLLQQLEASVDMKNRILRTRDTDIKIHYNPPPTTLHLLPRTEHRVKLPTNIQDGDAILNFTEFKKGVRMPSAIVKCRNGYAQTVIQNATDEHIKITITKAFIVTRNDEEMVNECKVNCMKEQYEIDTLLTENLSKLRLDHLNGEEHQSIYELCRQYKDIFYCDELPLTFTSQVKHQIRTKNEDPIYVKPYRQPPVQTAEIKNQVDKLLRDNIIQESHSPWSAPVHLVSKKPDASGEKKYRMVIDYRRLNEITLDDKYPLPNITDLFDKLGKSTYFTTLDLASGYHQIEVAESDRQKTAFSTQFGHYEFSRMPFGLKTAPATFQRAMDNILRGLQGIHCLIYLDDVIIFSSSLQEHLQKLRTVFDRLRATNLKVQLDKSEFLRKEVLYLGHTITKDGLRPNDDKITAVLNYPLPRTTTEIKSFLGLVGYYRKFIKDFAKVTQPMTDCLKKKNNINIDDKYIASFQKCKELLTNAPLLQYPDFQRPFVLTTDASNVALGAVLSQGTIGSDKPIAYASRSLNETERRYSTIEKELLAIIYAVKHFRPYLYGNKFYIYTDHRPLAWLYSLKEPNSKLTRWRLRLQEYNFEIIYKKGKQNTNADALSRIRVNALHKDETESMQVNTDESERRLQSHLDDVTNEIVRLGRSNRHDSSTITISENSDTLSISNSDIPHSPHFTIPSTSSNTDTIHSTEDSEPTGIPILHEAIDTKPNQILVFSWFRNQLLVKDLSRDKQKILEVFLPLDNPELIKDFLKKYIQNKKKYFIYFENKEHRKQFGTILISLFKKDMVNFMECTNRVVYVDNDSEQREIVLKFHEGKTCHRGIKETIVRIRRNYFWPKMKETVSAIINACDACRVMKYDRKPLKPMIQLTQTQNRPFQEIFIDIFSIESKYYLTLVDAFSKLGQAIEISNKSTPEVVRALVKYFSYYGIPKKISCDPGTEFNNDLFKELLTFYKINLHVGTPNNPNSMGIVERFHSTLIEIYRLAKYEQKCTDAASIMTYSIMAYNHTIHTTTELTPFEIVFGHTDSNNVFDNEFEKAYMQQLIRDHAKRTKTLYQHLTDKMIDTKKKIIKKKGGESERDFEIGDTIFAKSTNIRKSKDKPRYNKAVVTSKGTRNVVSAKVRDRETRIPVKNIKRPPQVVVSDPPDHSINPSTSKD